MKTLTFAISGFLVMTLGIYVNYIYRENYLSWSLISLGSIVTGWHGSKYIKA